MNSIYMNKEKASIQFFQKIWHETFNKYLILPKRAVGKQLKSLKALP